VSDNELRTDNLSPALAERFGMLVDILYLTQVVWLYVFAAIYPFMGLFYGILFLVGAKSDKTKKMGKILLILGIINTVLFIIAVGVMIALGAVGALAGLGD
jgi:uncharacterized membrane protein